MKVHQIVTASLLAAAVAVAIHAQSSQSEAQSFAEEVLQIPPSGLRQQKLCDLNAPMAEHPLEL
jgi:hypothetical protein